MREGVKPLWEEVYLEDSLAFLHPVLRAFLLYLKSLSLSVGIFILAILLPIPISLLNATLQLFRLKPLQALKSVLGGIFVCAGLVIVACLGVIPFLLKKIVSFVFSSEEQQLDEKVFDQDTGIDIGSAVSERWGKNAILNTTYTPRTNEGFRKRFASCLDEKTIQENGISQPNKTIHVISCSTISEVYPLSIVKKKALDSFDANLNCYVVFFHYPGALMNDKVDSINDLINAAIQITYDVIQRNNWTPAQVEEYLRLEGRSLGGGIAYHVALHFRKYHGIDIHVDGQNTFDLLSSVLSENFKFFFNLPLWCSHIFSKMILSAGGGFEMDTLTAALQLNPKCVHFSNIKYLKKYPKTAKTFFEKVDRFFWGPPDYYPDAAICEASLYNGIKKASKKNQNPSSTYYDYFQILDFKNNKAIHRIEKSKTTDFFETSDNHRCFTSYMRKPAPSDTKSITASPPGHRR